MRRYLSSLFFKKNNLYFILIVLLSLIPLLWFKNGFFLAGGDSSTYLGLEKKFNIFSAWDSYDNFGYYTRSLHHVIYSKLNNFFDFIPDCIFQKILFFLLFFFRTILYYKLLNLIFPKEEKKNLFFPSIIFFEINTYYLLSPIGLNDNLVPIQITLLFIFIYELLHKQKINFVYLIFISFMNSLLFSNVAALFTTYLPAIFYLIFSLFFIKKEKFILILRKIIYAILILIGLNLWYLIPIVKSFLEISGVNYVVNTFSAVQSGHLYDHFRLIGKWAWNSKHFLYYYFPFATNYNKPLLLFSTFIVSIFSLISFFLISLKNSYTKAEKRIFFFFSFLFLLGIILVNGSKLPLGRLFMEIYNSNHLFIIFREPFTKFSPLIIFSMPILLYGSVAYFNKIFKDKILKTCLYILLILVLFINVYPIFSGEVLWNKWNGSMRSYFVKIPNYWKDLKKYIIKSDLENFRLLALPASEYTTAYNWVNGLNSADNIAVNLLPNHIVRYLSFPQNNSDLVINQLFNRLSDKDFDLNNYLSLLNTRYVLQENDLDWRYSSKALNPSSIANILDNNGIKVIEAFGFFSNEYLSKIPNNEPNLKLHDSLYQELLNKQSLILYKIDDKYLLPHFYIPQRLIYSNGGIKSLIKITSSKDYKIKSGIYLDNIKESINFENNKLKERIDEIFIEGKLKNKITNEEITEKINFENIVYPSITRGPASLVYPLVLWKEKIEKWELRKNPEKLLEKNLLLASKRIAEIIKYKNTIKEGSKVKILENYQQEMIAALEILGNLKAEGNENFIKLLMEYESTLISHENREEIREWNGFKNLEMIFSDLEKKVNDLKAKHDFSKLTYEINIPQNGNYSLFIKGIDGNTSSLGEKYFNEGIQELVLPIKGISKNLIDKNLQIKNYLPNSIYELGFDYQSSSSGKISVKENNDKEISKIDLFPTEGDFKHLETFFQSSQESTSASVLFSDLENKSTNITYKNLQVKQIFQPELILKSDTKNVIRDKEQIPKITFIKINPTKYRIKVEGATDPYTLIFSESFHQGWKVYVNGSTQNEYGEITESYFNGDIKEGTHKNIFLDKNTFETWGKKPLSEDKHLMANGYANSWYITPEDSGGQQDYEIIVEFLPQRYFYIGLFISGLTLIICLVYLIIIMLKKIFRKK